MSGTNRGAVHPEELRPPLLGAHRNRPKPSPKYHRSRPWPASIDAPPNRSSDGRLQRHSTRPRGAPDCSPGGRQDNRPVPRPDLPVSRMADWVTPVVGLGGLVFAASTFAIGLAVGRGQIGAFKTAEKGRERAETDRLLSAARRITVWCDLATSNDDKYVLAAHNSGDEPVYGAVVYVATGSKEHQPPAEIVFMTLPPGQTLTADLPTEHVGTVPNFPFTPRVAIAFTDASGRHWRRGEDGQLEQQEFPARTC
jgi:hypothetical protein